ncbi:MAG: ABC transporter ATP-binding protein [Gammaproteobacteria bacterium]
MITLHNINYAYPGSSSPALRDPHLQIDAGSLFGLLGPNGAGKTTLLGILSGLIPSYQGRFALGIDEPFSQCGSLVPQELAFYPSLTVHENLSFFAGIQGLEDSTMRDRIDAAISTTALESQLDQAAGTLSGGVKRRLNLAIGLLNKPAFLLLDEPTVGIDPQSRRFILDTIKAVNRLGTTVIYTSHYMEEVEFLCDEIAIIDSGQVLQRGSLESLLKSSGDSTLRVYLTEALEARIAKTLQTSIGASIDDLQITATLDHPDKVYDIVATLKESGAAIKSIHYGPRNLEELFLELTQRSLRD